MLIKSISLNNFRNHAKYHLDCKPTTTLILGENGCGKTSVLEAIYILTQGKSFRATDPDIIKRNTDFYRIELGYDTGEKTTAVYNGKTKEFRVSDKVARRLPAKNKYPIILFLPSDLNLISGSPSRHRDYFDRFFSTLSQDYSSAVSRYNKAIRQRNELLKQETLDNSSLFSWNLLLAKYGTLLNQFRQSLITEINSTLTDTYHTIANNKDRIFIDYQTEATDISENDYLKILESSFEKDRLLGHTSYGVHRDDFEFIFNDSAADTSASRGETRSIILALKFIEANIINTRLGKRPIILLDDVFSELDNERRSALVNNFKDHQVIITSVEMLGDV